MPRDESKRPAAALLQTLGLEQDANKLIVDYSVGMRKKIALAAALIHRPQVLFLGEPLEGIDPVSSRTIRDILHDLTQHGTTVFFSSHTLEVLGRLSSRIRIRNQAILVAARTRDK